MNGIISWWANNRVAANLLMVGILIAGMTREFEVDVLESLLVPLQLPTNQPPLGLAVSATLSPAWY